jgi:hypothetical protein
VLSEQLPVGGAGELSAAIGMNDKILRVGTLIKSHTQSGAAKRGIEKLAHGPTDYTAAKDIQNSDQVEKKEKGQS